MDTEITLTELLNEYDTCNAQQSQMSWNKIKILLKELRRSKIRRPEIVLKHGPSFINQESYIEVWNLHEQICIAALEVGNMSVAKDTIEKLSKQFPDSNRIRRLQGMFLEAQGKFTEALVVYDDILKKDLANLAAMKRKAAIRKAQNDIPAFINEINSILNYFPSDSGSWVELAEVYLGLCDYSAAAHCLEELVLLEPRDAHHHCRLAEAYYSMGNENVILARKHYTISLNHQAPKFNLRALYGLLSCCKVIQGEKVTSSTPNTKTPGNDEHDIKVNIALLQYATEQLASLVSENSNNTALGLVQSSIVN